jgi:hypothetical protein
MDKLMNYQALIHQVLEGYQALTHSDENLETILLFDDTQKQYLMLRSGWEGTDRIERIIIHVRIRDDKIWIEEDCTEDGVATDFLLAGVPREAIVLAFHPPHLRQHTEFATA